MAAIDQPAPEGASRPAEYTHLRRSRVSEPFGNDNPRYRPEVQQAVTIWIADQLGLSPDGTTGSIGMDMPKVHQKLARFQEGELVGVSPEQAFIYMDFPHELGLGPSTAVERDPVGFRRIAEGYAAALGGNARVIEYTGSSKPDARARQYGLLLPVEIELQLQT